LGSDDPILNLKSVIHGYPNDRDRSDLASLKTKFHHDLKIHQHNEKNLFDFNPATDSGGLIGDPGIQYGLHPSARSLLCME